MELRKAFAYINGGFYPGEDAKISIFDRAVQGGASIFESESLWKGHILQLDGHIDRLYRSMKMMRLDIKKSKEELKGLVLETVKRSGLRDAYVCQIVSWGAYDMDAGPEHECTLIIFAKPFVYNFGDTNSEKYEKGVSVKVSSLRQHSVQSLDAKVKHFNRWHMQLAQLEARDFGADGAILLDLDGYVTEGKGENVWIVKDGKLITPEENILWGITRKLVFEIAAEQNIEASTSRLTPYDLYNADEVFFSTSPAGIYPVIEVDKRVIGDGKPGPVSKKIKGLYWEKHADPKYSTPVKY
jgi:branched-chain amino acid aminotransferase